MNASPRPHVKPVIRPLSSVNIRPVSSTVLRRPVSKTPPVSSTVMTQSDINVTSNVIRPTTRSLSRATSVPPRASSASSKPTIRPLSPSPIRPNIRPLTKPAPKPNVRLSVPGLKRALLVGINYINSRYELAGCVNDVLNMKSQLETFFPNCNEYKVITDFTEEKPSRKNIIAAFDWLVKDLRPGENVFFQYSGHGGQVRDTNGDEVSGYDSCIYPFNGTMEIITDDVIRSYIAEKIPAGSKCFIVLDACHSGTAVDLRYKWESLSSQKIAYSENNHYKKLNGNVIFLSGCMDTQTAADTADENWRPCGALSWALLETWRSYGRGIKIKHLLWDVREFLRSRGYSQKPELTSGNYFDMNQIFDLSK